ncbi:hypothetical protein AWN76_016350 [Rhodothermaceae bacterium RA]|nr:hypothetical protein AWN76_016350 [Rhodothermaceae bacterium RA]
MPVISQLLRTLRYAYCRVARPQETSVYDDIARTLGRTRLFEGVPRSMLRELAEVVHRRTYRRDQILYFEGDPGIGLYVVQKGLVRLFVQDEQGSVHEMRQVQEYGVFGELSILGDVRRLETAQAVVDTEVLGLFSPDIRTLANRNPRTGNAVLTALVRYLAAGQIELIRVLVERDGPVAAMRLVDGPAPRPA